MISKIFVTVVVFACSASVPLSWAYGNDMEMHDDYGFYLEYPKNWVVADSWASQNTIIWHSDDGDYAITVTLQDEYALITPRGLESASFDDINWASLDDVTASTQKACRDNTYNQCWSYEQLDAGLLVAGDKPAMLVVYSAKINNEDRIVHHLIVPDDVGVWVVESSAPEPMDGVLRSFTVGDDTTHVDPATIAGIIKKISNNEDIILERDIMVNLIMVGDKWIPADMQHISENVNAYFDPLYTQSGEKVGVRYNYSIEFASYDDAHKLQEFMSENSVSRPIFGAGMFDEPIWLQYWVASALPHMEDKYRLVDATNVEEFLYKAYIQPYQNRTGQYVANLVFLNFEPQEYIYNYFTENSDKGTGSTVRQVGLMGYGGTYNMMFFDMYAVPWIDYESGSYVIPGHAVSLLHCDASDCRTDIAAGHIHDALNHIVTPSFLYPVGSDDTYVVDILAYVVPRGIYSVTPVTIRQMVDVDGMVNELEYLYPYTKWDVRITIERRDTSGISYEFKKQLEGHVSVALDNPFGSDRTIRLLDHAKIQPLLLEWANKSSDDAPRHIPVLLIMYPSLTDVYLGYGVLGIAPSLMSDEHNPCCAMAVANYGDFWSTGIGATDLLLHEIGHVLGLHHPFFGFDEYGVRHHNGYFNWYASPMTYAAPLSAWNCGTIYGLIYDDPCGNASLSFTVFERESVSDARLVWLLRELYEADSPHVEEILYRFEAGDMFSLRGALHQAIKAHGALSPPAQ